MNLQLSWQSIGLLIRGSWVRAPPGSHISLFSPQLLGAGVFWRDDEIGIHGRLKICWALCPWGFESPSRYYLLYGVIGNTTDFGSVVGESYSSMATLYIMYTRTLLYILAIYKKKQYNCKNMWRVSPLSISHLSLRCTTSLLHPPRPRIFRAKIPQLFSFAKMHLVLEF